MNDAITIYYYTAWDGFAWQGCDEATAKSLQGYMEATRTLPKSSVDEPPFGGAVPCKIAGQVGVAVYRYHTRLKGDLSGRDSLYIALAFVPLSTGCVDFSKLLEMPELAETQSGALNPKKLSASENGLRASNLNDVPYDWLDRDIDGTEYHVLNGRSGLLTLSRLFFSKHTQLGFLNSVFNLKSGTGIDGLEAVQSYSVYREVKNVAAAAEAWQRAKLLAGGALPKDIRSIDALKSALGELDAWASKQPGYPGLREYYDAKRMELCDDAERLEAIKDFSGRLKNAVDGISRMAVSFDRHGGETVIQCLGTNERKKVEDCAKLAAEVVALRVLDHPSYCDVVRHSLEAMKRAASIIGMQEFAQGVESEWIRLNKELKRVSAEVYRVSEAKKQIEERLMKNIGEKEKEIKRLSAKRPEVTKGDATGGINLGTAVDRRPASKKKGGLRSLLPVGPLDWTLTTLSVVFIVVLIILIYKMFLGGASKDPSIVANPTNDVIVAVDTNKVNNGKGGIDGAPLETSKGTKADADTPTIKSTDEAINRVGQAGCEDKPSAGKQKSTPGKQKKTVNDKPDVKEPAVANEKGSLKIVSEALRNLWIKIGDAGKTDKANAGKTQTPKKEGGK